MSDKRIYLDTSFEILANRVNGYRDLWQRQPLGAGYHDAANLEPLTDRTRTALLDAFARLIVATESASCMTPPEDAESELASIIRDAITDRFFEEQERVRGLAEGARNERRAA